MHVGAASSGREPAVESLGGGGRQAPADDAENECLHYFPLKTLTESLLLYAGARARARQEAVKGYVPQRAAEDEWKDTGWELLTERATLALC